MKAKALGDKILIKPIEEDKTTSGGIVLPETAKTKKL